MPPPWNNWYHCTAHTYGTWLRGDPRGWRSRHHREHVEGNHKHPPPKGKYDALYAHSKSLMKRDPVRIEHHLRQFVLDAIITKLQDNQIQIACASLDGIHLHILLRCPDHNPRHLLGFAKKHSAHQIRTLHLLPEGGLWSKGSHPEPITSPAHFDRTINYIHDHRHHGALVWTPQTPAPALHISLHDFDPTGLLLE